MDSFYKSLKLRKLSLLCFAGVKYYQRRSERLFELILVLQGDLVYIILGCFVNFLHDMMSDMIYDLNLLLVLDQYSAG